MYQKALKKLGAYSALYVNEYVFESKRINKSQNSA